MKNRTINLGVVAEVAKGLGDLNDSVVFVGGAVVSVYADDPAAEDIRPTKDIDLALKLLDLSQIELDIKLAKLGFHLDLQGHATCRYNYNDIAVDVITLADPMTGPDLLWYEIGLESTLEIIVNEIVVRVFSAPNYLATKFAAFSDRGQNDHRLSHDFEDIIYVVDNHSTIVDEINKADHRVRNYLTSEFLKVMDSPHREEILSAHLHPFIAEHRYPILVGKLQAILGGCIERK